MFCVAEGGDAATHGVRQLSLGGGAPPARVRESAPRRRRGRAVRQLRERGRCLGAPLRRPGDQGADRRPGQPHRGQGDSAAAPGRAHGRQHPDSQGITTP